MTFLAPQIETVRRVEPLRVRGRVSGLRGMTLLVDDLSAPVGALVRVGASRRPAEVVGFTRGQTVLMTLGQTSGIATGDAVELVEPAPSALVGERLLGRVVNGLGAPIDGGPPIADLVPRPLCPDPIPALARRRITRPLLTGVRAIDLMTTLGCGQRAGIFSGPGVGKSTLLGMIARGTSADVNVIALVGERGREVPDFLDHALGPEGLQRSVVVVATSDESPLMRVRAAQYACAAAEFYRARGRHVLLMMDSITRFAHAQRQIGLSIGEPPATRGYTPSVFSGMALLLERAGAIVGDGGDGGSITGLYTILVEGDDLTEPVADTARGILDGHIVLARSIAQRAHYPAIDVLDSISRVVDDVCEPQHAAARRQAIRLLAEYREVEDLVQIGAYAAGSNAAADVAIAYRPRLLELLAQGRTERADFDEARSRLVRLAVESGEELAKRRGKGA